MTGLMVCIIPFGIYTVKEKNMSFVAAMIISNDCTDTKLEQLRDVYGISLKEVNNPSIRHQLDVKQKFYMFSDDTNGYFWNNWTPIGRKKLFETAKDTPYDDYEEGYLKIATKWESEFNLRYISFEAQMYIIIIKYLKIICNVQNVGLVGFMMNDSCDNYQFPIFDKVTVQIKNLNSDVLYKMKENCIYYFD